MLGVASLGFYRMSHNLAEMATTDVTRVTSQVLFSTYSRLQDQRARLRGAYLRSLSLVTLISLPIAAVTVPLAYHFIEVVLGEKWLPMAPAFQVLMAVGAIRSLSTTVGPLLSGVGRPDIVTKIQFVKLIILGVIAYPATRYWGLTGAATAFLIGTALLDGAAFIIANRILGSSLGDLRRILVYPVMCALAAGLAPFAAMRAWHAEPSIVGLVLLAGLGFVTYVASVAVCRGLFGYTAGGLLSWKTVRGMAS
jgi:O-antigen/teichoic acid export membrane protein